MKESILTIALTLFFGVICAGLVVLARIRTSHIANQLESISANHYQLDLGWDSNLITEMKV